MSTVDFEILKKVPTKTERLISGYFREYQTILSKIHGQNSYYNIPQLSLMITLSYYALCEYFKIINEDTIALSENNTCITRKDGTWNNTSYGNVTVNPSKDEGIYKWYIKILKMSFAGMIGIGGNHESVKEQDALNYDNCRPSYVFNCYYGGIITNTIADFVTKSYMNAPFGRIRAPYLRDGDTLCVEFNVDQKYIKYYLNEKDFGIAFTEKDIIINQDIEYRLGISLCDGGDSFKIFNFEHEFC